MEISPLSPFLARAGGFGFGEPALGCAALPVSLLAEGQTLLYFIFVVGLLFCSFTTARRKRQAG
jgi:hypothetical protein